MRFPFLFALVFLSFSAGATRIQCNSIAEVKRDLEDDPCEAYEDAADACWGSLNAEFYRLKDNPASSTEDRLQRKKLLLEDYKRGLARIREYLGVVKNTGEDKMGCLDQIPAIKVYVEETESDIKDIAQF